MAGSGQAFCESRDDSQKSMSPLLCLGPISLLQSAADRGPTTAVNISQTRERSIPVSTDDERPALVSAVSTQRQEYPMDGASSKYHEQHRSRKKKHPVLRACNRCRARKTRCSGQRPTCDFCQARGLICEWEVPSGLERAEDVRRRLETAEKYLHDVQVMIEALKSGSDQTLKSLLAQLRAGVSVSDLAEFIKSNSTASTTCQDSAEDERFQELFM